MTTVTLYGRHPMERQKIHFQGTNTVTAKRFWHLHCRCWECRNFSCIYTAKPEDSTPTWSQQSRKSLLLKKSVFHASFNKGVWDIMAASSDYVFAEEKKKRNRTPFDSIFNAHRGILFFLFYFNFSLKPCSCWELISYRWNYFYYVKPEQSGFVLTGWSEQTSKC